MYIPGCSFRFYPYTGTSLVLQANINIQYRQLHWDSSTSANTEDQGPIIHEQQDFPFCRYLCDKQADSQISDCQINLYHIPQIPNLQIELHRTVQGLHWLLWYK